MEFKSVLKIMYGDKVDVKKRDSLDKLVKDGFKSEYDIVTEGYQYDSETLICWIEDSKGRILSSGQLSSHYIVGIFNRYSKNFKDYNVEFFKRKPMFLKYINTKNICLQNLYQERPMIEGLVTNENFRRRGFCTRIIEALIQGSTVKSEIFIESTREHTSQLYKKLGFNELIVKYPSNNLFYTLGVYEKKDC